MANWFSARILLAGFILLLTALLVVLVVGNIRSGPPEAILDVVRPDADLAMQKINYTETQDGVRKWSLRADSATHDFKGKVAAVENIDMVIYDPLRGDISVRAKSGRFDMAKGVVTLRGDVVLQNVSGQSIYTERLDFIDAKNQLRTDEDVKVLAGNIDLTGTGMRYDLELGKLTILSSVMAEFKDDVELP